MDTNDAVDALAALAQDTRLSAFRLLVRAGHGGLPAGEIATALGVPHNTLSTHLAVLVRASLIGAERDGRRIIYRVDFDRARSVLEFLVADCCAGDSTLTKQALASTFAGCCTPAPTRSSV